ncbi:sensor histidine kinase [Streptomyces sp. H27-D2]|uniref:sensor histidine kinase n=1 Tax=Streptomyces sp. H27-D2 TaxID=3046304 RepID=UPI002DC02A31|nr:HAMP domain-containing sensor histidine kinase [Streptomyces sp. H27-D2]MEC4015382.1 HAMP domain-containing sensor histidine kinase [Streptomyces sp. H27-D2]
MRHRVVRVAVVAVTVALILLALPLAVVIRASYFAEERGELERQALAAAVRVGPRFASGDAVELPTAEPGVRVGVYDPARRLRAGAGPDRADTATRRAAGGAVAQATSGADLVVAVPVPAAEQVIGVVRASSRTQDVWNRIFLTWLALLGTALAALAAAVLVARHQARALSRPLEALSATVQAVADGDLNARAAPSAIPEIDQVAHTQNAMVTRLTRLLRHERHFSANASHQLRTPLTGLQLGLEAALEHPHPDPRAALRQALEGSRHLQATIDEVLRMSTAAHDPATATTPQPAAALLTAGEERWHGIFARQGRRLRLTVEPGAGTALLPGSTAAQILDVLLDNARQHGRGTVDVTLREIGGAVAVDVADEGTLALDPAAAFARGTTTGQGLGIGLALARELAEAAGGRLRVAGSTPTTFTLLLPAPR